MARRIAFGAGAAAFLPFRIARIAFAMAGGERRRLLSRKDGCFCGELLEPKKEGYAPPLQYVKHYRLRLPHNTVRRRSDLSSFFTPPRTTT